MKNLLLSMLFLFSCLISVESQVLYSTTLRGGIEGLGTIVKFQTDTNTIEVKKSFGAKEHLASNPVYNNLIEANDGKFYGMTSKGGSNNLGVIFSYDPTASAYKKLVDFNNDNGAKPEGSLIQLSNGILYGMTSEGGAFGFGVIFSFNPSTSSYTTVFNFDYATGAKPSGSLIAAANGKLYGLTLLGGSHASGVIFSFDPSSASYQKVFDFNYISGVNPYGSLTETVDGKLYGMTYGGGLFDCGVIFSFDPSSANYLKLLDFNFTNGAKPWGSLIYANDGKLYGMTSDGGNKGYGIIFSFNPFSFVYTVLKHFDYSGAFTSDGARPFGDLVQAINGKLYGMTWTGGYYGYGVIFSIDPSSSTYLKLNDFTQFNGSYPAGSLTKGSNGKLYGMTGNGGLQDFGTIFYFDPTTSIYTKLKDFGSLENGLNVTGSLVQTNDKRLFGMTSNGGSFDAGIIFSYDLTSSVYTKLKDFNYKDGSNPRGGLLQGSNGKLYGMTSGGGNSERGTVFSFDPNSFNYEKLIDFNGATGAAPNGNLTEATDGKFYGVTQLGGKNDGGVIFSFNPFSKTYTKLWDFDAVGIRENGTNPVGTLIQAKDGKLYGLTSYGGVDNLGVIFSFDPVSLQYSKLKDFFADNGDQDGYNPYGSLIEGSDGKLYGMTSDGGKYNLGVIFSFDPAFSVYKTLKNFKYDDGARPYGSLFEASDKKLYGMTKYGGINDLGVIFSFDPRTGNYLKLQDYNGANGASPDIGATFIEKKSDNESFPTVTLTTPFFKYTAPASIILTAVAHDTDGTITKVEFYNGNNLLYTKTTPPFSFEWKNVLPADYIITAKAFDNSGLSTTSNTIKVSVVNYNIAPIVTIVAPGSDTTYAAFATVKLLAEAKDPNDKISKVEFFNGDILLATERYYPYTFSRSYAPAGTYTITAVAWDDKGLSDTSAPIKITVLQNIAPTVSMVSPLETVIFTDPATINLEASASDPDGTISRVGFYNGRTLLKIETTAPYTFKWKNVPVGKYIITAKAMDNWGKVTTSNPLQVVVTGGKAVITRANNLLEQTLPLNNITTNNALIAKVYPNPTKNFVNIYSNEFENKKIIVSVISASGALLKTTQLNVSNNVVKLDLSFLSKGVYTLKFISGNKVLYNKVVKQ